MINKIFIIRKKIFYKIYPNFNWKFYFSYYSDLNKAGLKTENDAIRHYYMYGKKEGRKYQHSEELISKTVKIVEGKSKITFKIIKENTTDEFINNKLWAHLHCYDINAFDEIYGKYIEEIMKYFSVVITYSKGSNLPKYNFNILNIPNKGMDIGGKMCTINFLKNKNIVFDFILMLQSKSNIRQRKKYFDPYLTNLKKIVSNLNQDKGIYCSNHLHHYHIKNTDTLSWGRNEIWMNYIVDKFLLPKDNFTFAEGNNYILHREVANYMFDNRFDVYQYLNTIDSFDYSWVVNYYKLEKLSKEQVYQKYKRENLYGNNLELGKGWDGLADCMIEHTFERITFSVCKLLNKKVEIIK